MACKGSDWELVTDCETAGVITGKMELPVRSHPWVPVGEVFAINRAMLAGYGSEESGNGTESHP